MADEQHGVELSGSHPLRRVLCMLMFDYRKHILSVPLTLDSLYDDIMGRVYTKWNGMRSSKISFKYAIGNYPNVSLDVLDDFTALLYHVLKFRPSTVDIVVMFDDDVIVQPNVQPTMPVNSTSSVHSDMSVCGNSHRLQYDPLIPSYDTNPHQVDHPLVSDSWSNLIKGVGQRFIGGRVDFKEKLIKYAAKGCFKFAYSKNNMQGVSVFCKQRDISGCPWKISGTCKMIDHVDGVFVINSGVFTHTCTDVIMQEDISRLSSKVIASMVTESVKQNPGYGGISLKNLLYGHFGLDVPYMKAWRSIKYAREKIYGVYAESFNDLRWYCEVARMTNPGTITDLQADSTTNCFSRVFIAFKASLDGFKECRPLLFIDGTSLKGKFKGVLLTAIAKDGDNGLFPVAFAVVACENTEHWTYFIRMIRDHVKHEKKISFLSDRHAGIMNAFPDVYDEPLHFFCLFHLYTNLKTKYSGGWSFGIRRKMISLLKLCAYAPTKSQYHQYIVDFKEAGGAQAVKFLENLPPERWAVAFAPNVVRYGEMTSNAAESFNSVIKEVRSLPLRAMLDSIRQLIMSWYNDRRADAAGWTGLLCPSKEYRWDAHRHQGGTWKVLDSHTRAGVYEVLSDTTQVVDLNARKCSCFRWQMLGFPCVHAVRVMYVKSANISTLVDPCFFAQTYRQTYSHTLHPIPTSLRAEAERNIGKFDFIVAPPRKVQAGNPKRKRIPSFGQKPHKRSKKSICPNYHKVGRHDITTCGNNIVHDIRALHQQFHERESTLYDSESDWSD